MPAWEKRENLTAIDLVQLLVGKIEEDGYINQRTRVQIWLGGMQLLRDYDRDYPGFDHLKNNFRNTGFDGGRNPW